MNITNRKSTKNLFRDLGYSAMFLLKKKSIKTFIFAVLSLSILTSCKGTVKGTIKGTNVTGTWHHEVSKRMGGYQITKKTKLTITRKGPGDYQYQLKTTVIDQMYGGVPKDNYTSGRLEEEVHDNNWRFEGGDFGNRGGFIKVPSDNWDDYKPSTITVYFSSGRGNPMTFTRY